MERTGLSIFFKGLIVGGTMMIPGVSGGTMAMILGIYDKLIYAVSSFRKMPLENIGILLKFVVGGIFGLLLFSTPLLWLLENYEVPVLYFFMGIVFGGIPLIGRKCGIGKLSMKDIIFMLAGTGIVLVFSAIPKGVFTIESSFVSLLSVGSIAAVALILPGISISHFFLVLGMYEEILVAIKHLEVITLLPLTAGIGLGIILFSKILGMLMEKHQKQTFLMILGFILGSVAGIFPGIPFGAGNVILIITCLALFVFGFFVIYKIQNN